MTSVFDPQQYSNYLPYLNGSPVDSSATDPPAPIRFRRFALPKDDPDHEVAIGFEFVIDDLRGPRVQQGDFGRGANQFDGDYRSLSNGIGIDPRFRRHLLLSQGQDSQTLTGVATRTAYGANIADAFYMAIGGPLTPTSVIFKETSATDPTLVGTGFRWGTFPPSYISGIWGIVIGGATQAERVLVGYVDGTAQVLQLDGVTVDGTMHANLSYLWGYAPSPINATTPGTGTHLFYAGSAAGIWTLPLTSAIAAAPTQVMSNIPSGGRSLGVERLPNGAFDLRWFLWWPNQNSGFQTALFSNPIPGGRLVHLNLEGTDPLPVPIALSRIIFADFWRRNIVASDGWAVKTFDGATTRDLHCLDGHVANSDYRLSVAQLIISGDDLLVIKQAQDLTGGGAHLQWMEQYLPEFDSWVPISDYIGWATSLYTSGYDTSTYMSGLRLTAKSGGSLPVSKQTGYVHMLDQGTASRRQFLAPSQHNPYYHYRQTGSSQNMARKWNTSGTADSAIFALEGLEGRFKKMDQIVYLGECPTNCQVGIAINDSGYTVFDSNHPNTAQAADFGGDGLFDLIQIHWQLQQLSGTTRTPNGIPVLFRGRAYLTDPATDDLGVPGDVK